MSRDVLHFPEADRASLEAYLPPKNYHTGDSRIPYTTLTFATSLDSMIALRPGVPTALSGPRSKAMTHYLRSKHDGILIGVGTAVADDPSLNCRIEGAGGYGGVGLENQPRPIIVDPSARWEFSEQSKLFALIKEGRGRAPFIITADESPPRKQQDLLDKYGGKYIQIEMTIQDGKQRLNWNLVHEAISREGISSVMIEGGANVINSFLDAEFQPLVDSVIVTIAPTWLGQGGASVSPEARHNEEGKPTAAARLTSVQWHQSGEDVVMCGRLR